MCIFKRLKRARLEKELSNLNNQLNLELEAKNYYQLAAKMAKVSSKSLAKKEKQCENTDSLSYSQNIDILIFTSNALLLKANNHQTRAIFLQTEIDKIETQLREL